MSRTVWSGPLAVVSGDGSVHEAVPADGEFSDEELTELALAADPSAPLAEDAVPLSVYLDQFGGPLPEWYMPPPRGRASRYWVPLVWAVIAAFLAIEAAGLCSTYGQPPLH